MLAEYSDGARPESPQARFDRPFFLLVRMPEEVWQPVWVDLHANGRCASNTVPPGGVNFRELLSGLVKDLRKAPRVGGSDLPMTKPASSMSEVRFWRSLLPAVQP
jgi:hypothetical protein